jgi:hypothetical protein
MVEISKDGNAIKATVPSDPQAQINFPSEVPNKYKQISQPMKRFNYVVLFCFVLFCFVLFCFDWDITNGFITMGYEPELTSHPRTSP